MKYTQRNPHPEDPADTQRSDGWMRRLVRRLARLRIAYCFLSEYEWFRRFHGGKWMRSHVDHPVCSYLWMDVPDCATPDYREPGWRGRAEFKDYDSPTNADVEARR